MINYKSKFSWIDGYAFFLLVLLANIAGLFFTTYYPTMDGPAHLYNSKVLLEVISGNNILQQFYAINVIPIPNWLSHFVLSLSSTILPAYLAEKVLLVLYVAGMAISFRLLISLLAPDNKGFSLLIFPFLYTFLFYLGFFNYSLSFIFFFLTLWVWIKYDELGVTLKIKLFLMLLLTLTYLGNILTYGFLGITLACYITCEALRFYSQTNDIKRSAKKWWAHTLLLFNVSLPSLICFIIFYVKTHFFVTDQRLPKDELIKWLLDNRSMIVYDYLKDEMYTKKIFWIMVFLILCIAYRRIREYEITNKITFSKSDVILLPLVVSLSLYFIIADGSGAGMMSIRYCILISFLTILWLTTQVLPNFSKVLILLALFLSAGLHFNHVHVLRDFDAHATAIHQLADLIDEGSVVLPVNHSDNWLEGHFSNYLGVDKPMIILENYEAAVGWFPILWNIDQMPRVLLAGRDKIENVLWVSNTAASETKEIDYVMIYGNQIKINETQWLELKSVLDKSFTKSSSNEFVSLYKRKH